MANYRGIIFDSYSKSVMAISNSVLFHNRTDLQFQVSKCLDKHDNHVQQLAKWKNRMLPCATLLTLYGVYGNQVHAVIANKYY